MNNKRDRAEKSALKFEEESLLFVVVTYKYLNPMSVVPCAHTFLYHGYFENILIVIMVPVVSLWGNMGNETGLDSNPYTYKHI
jgi:hypothetical protein